jgi:4-amino-4-deoxy-L-arabinose transferase-like glycosyltransferase
MKCIFKVNHIFRISILLLHVSMLHEHHLQGAQRISYFTTSFINILTTDKPNLYTFSQCIFYFNFGTYDVAYAKFHQDPLRSLKIALLQRRNM